jgi:hypothetical protein
MNWSYALTPQEEALAITVGFERQKPMLAQPERNRNYSEGDIWETWQHAISAGSEIAAARIIGLDNFVPHFNTFKTKLDIPGFEVRYCFTRKVPGYPSHVLRISERVDDLNAKYILITGGPEAKTRRTEANGWRGPAYNAVGWLKGSDAIKPQYVAPYGKQNYIVPVSELNNMEDLHRG